MLDQLDDHEVRRPVKPPDEKKKNALFYLISRDGKAISNGCVLTWLCFIICCVYWIREFIYPGSGDLPQSLQDALQLCLFYMLGGTALYTGRSLGSKYVDRKYSGSRYGYDDDEYRRENRNPSGGLASPGANRLDNL